MQLVLLPSRLLTSVSAAAAFAVIASAAPADVVIEFTGVNLVYDGSSIYDADSITGGLGNPSDADPLASVDFFVNGGLVGSLTSDISLDLFIPDVTGISDAANTVDVQTTPGNPGFFDLLIGTSPLASEFLLIDLEEVTITYIDIAGLAQFTFGASISDTYAQNIPFGLTITGPVTVSFSAQIDPGSLTSAGGTVTGFTASGTGELRAIPGPGAALLLGIGACAAPRMRRRRAA